MDQSTAEQRSKGASAEREEEEEEEEEEEGMEERREDGCWERAVMRPLWPSH